MGQPQGQTVETKDEMLRNITADYLKNINKTNPPDPAEIQRSLIDTACVNFSIRNANAASGSKWRLPDRLVPAQIADVLAALYPIVNIAFGGLNAGTEYDVLGIYQEDGPDKGIYVTNTRTLDLLIHQYCYTLSDKETQETILMLRNRVPRVTRCEEKNLIAVNNGIFDYDTKQLMPFSPDYIFTSKSKVNYNPNAANPIIHNDEDGTDWDVESWMKELFDDEDIRNLMWEIIGAIIRPNVPWNKSAWFYSNTGNNGKGTLCELMRQITGPGTYASIPLSDFSKNFMLEPLLGASAIIVDENDVGTFIDKAANLKAIITNDVIQMDRKFKTPIAFRFKGFMVQCLNELPRIRDKSDSFYRRQLFVPFDKCFTGRERKYIKYDYLHRTDILEYVLKKVLNMDYYALSEPEACRSALEEYKGFNDPIRQFIEEILPQCQWDLLPYTFLFELYKEWFRQTSPSGQLQGRNTFMQDFQKALYGNTEWYIPQNQAIRPASLMDRPEPLVKEYNLENWMDPSQKGDMVYRPILKDHYRGILRYGTNTQQDKN